MLNPPPSSPRLSPCSSSSSFTSSPPHNHPHPFQNQKPILLLRLMSKRRTWVLLFTAVYTILLYSSWNLLRTILTWYSTSSSSSTSFPSSAGLAALYASMMLGLLFGLLSMAAALAVAVPAMLVTWITVLVLLAFCGRRRRDLVVVAKNLTAEIVGFVFRIVVKEGNVVAAVCAVLGYFLLVRSREEDGGGI